MRYLVLVPWVVALALIMMSRLGIKTSVQMILVWGMVCVFPMPTAMNVVVPLGIRVKIAKWITVHHVTAILAQMAAPVLKIAAVITNAFVPQTIRGNTVRLK